MISFESTILVISVTIFVGFILQQFNVLSDTEWRGLERIAYYVLLPSLLFNSLSQTSSMPGSAVFLFVCLIFGALLLTLVIIILSKRNSWSGGVFSSAFQGALRWNGYFALAIGESLEHTDLYFLIVMSVALYVPIVNIASIVVLKLTSKSTEEPRYSLYSEILLNPIIIACTLGFLANISGFTMSPPFADFIKSAGSAAIPIGLLVIGGSLNLKCLLNHIGIISLVTLLKIIAFPVLVYVAAITLELPDVYRNAVVICAAAPTAPSSFILARQLGGNHLAMSGIVTLSTLASLLSFHFISKVL